MNWQLLNIVLGQIAFLLFIIIQSLIINGIKASFDKEMIFEKYGNWVRSLGWIGKPLGACIKCMGSLFGGILYWPATIYLFGFETWQIPVFIANVFCVSVLSFYFYKKL